MPYDDRPSFMDDYSSHLEENALAAREKEAKEALKKQLANMTKGLAERDVRGWEVGSIPSGSSKSAVSFIILFCSAAHLLPH